MADCVPRRAVIDVAHRKRGKYMPKCAAIGYGFHPFSLSSLGELEAGAVTLLKRMRKFFMAQDIGTRAAVHIFNRISFATAKGVDAQIVAQRKRVKYEAKCADIRYDFLPFSFSCFGELEKDAVTLLKQIRKFFVSQDIRARAAIHIFSRISFAIARGV
ncbi:hypothetical protein Tco_0675191 [Tanacetum coccineum]